MGSLLILNPSPMNNDPGKNPNSQQSQGQNGSDAIHSPRSLHHPVLWSGPVLLPG
jgi:hypothetical protein